MFHRKKILEDTIPLVLELLAYMVFLKSTTWNFSVLILMFGCCL